jgi:hypothetical protein
MGKTMVEPELAIHCSNGVITATRGYVVIEVETGITTYWIGTLTSASTDADCTIFTGTVGAGPLDRTTVTRITASADAIAAGVNILLLLRLPPRF